MVFIDRHIVIRTLDNETSLVINQHFYSLVFETAYFGIEGCSEVERFANGKLDSYPRPIPWFLNTWYISSESRLKIILK